MTAIPKQPLVERVAEAVCPLIKPWMDSGDVPPHPCKRCSSIEADGELAIPACKLVMRNVATAALAACHGEEMFATLNEIASWGEGETVGSWFDEPGAATKARAVLAKLEGKP